LATVTLVCWSHRCFALLVAVVVIMNNIVAVVVIMSNMIKEH
jgi:hypothetical protein